MIDRHVTVVLRALDSRLGCLSLRASAGPVETWQEGLP